MFLNAAGSRLSRTVTCVLVCATEGKILMISCLCLDIMDVHLHESFARNLCVVLCELCWFNASVGSHEGHYHRYGFLRSIVRMTVKSVA